jgi:hypothetical protein
VTSSLKICCSRGFPSFLPPTQSNVLTTRRRRTKESLYTDEEVEVSDLSRLPTSVCPRLFGTKLRKLHAVLSDTPPRRLSRTRGTRSLSTCGLLVVFSTPCCVVSLVSTEFSIALSRATNLFRLLASHSFLRREYQRIDREGCPRVLHLLKSMVGRYLAFW